MIERVEGIEGEGGRERQGQKVIEGEGKREGALDSVDSAIADGMDCSTIEDSGQSRKPPAVAMYCTGGIRCEKATAYMKQLGFKDVYHLKGGILKYLEEVPESESLWEGECFVFDDRVSLRHGLQEGSYSMCYACKMPLSHAECHEGDAAAAFEEGVSCLHCLPTMTEQQRQRHRERQRQVELARERGEAHIGQDGIPLCA